MINSLSCGDYLWWVIPERLAGMPRPPLKDLPLLYQLGIRGIVSLVNEPDLILNYEKMQFQALSLPIIEDLAPSVLQVKEFVKFTDNIISKNQAVAVHCTGGNHRTGTLLAAYFVVKGENPDAVMQRIQQIHPTAQLSKPQTRWLRELPHLLEVY